MGIDFPLAFTLFTNTICRDTKVVELDENVADFFGIEKFLRTKTGHSQPDSKCLNSYSESDARKSLLMISGIKICLEEAPIPPPSSRRGAHYVGAGEKSPK
jgi:hypothetical protein